MYDGITCYESIGKFLAKEGKYTSACVRENIQPVLTKTSTLHYIYYTRVTRVINFVTPSYTNNVHSPLITLSNGQKHQKHALYGSGRRSSPTLYGE